VCNTTVQLFHVCLSICLHESTYCSPGHVGKGGNLWKGWSQEGLPLADAPLQIMYETPPLLHAHLLCSFLNWLYLTYLTPLWAYFDKI
jgi:hypothetical protein